MENNTVFVAVNNKTNEFVSKYKWLIVKACMSVGLQSCDHYIVIDDLAYKYANGTFNYDETKGVKESTFVYMRAHNLAYDICCKGIRPEVSLEDNEWNAIAESHPVHLSHAEDERFIVREALNRLAKDCDSRKVEILVRYVLRDENRDELAKEYNERPDNISLIKMRMLPLLQNHVRNVIREDAEGRLKPSPKRVQFLKKYLEWL